MNTGTNTAIPQLELTTFARPRGGFTPREAVEIGGRLALLKASSLHGEWMQRLELMGFNGGEASRLMKVYAVFKGESNQRLLDAVGVVSKLIELSTLDIDQIETLNSGGEVHGLTLEGLKTMTVSEVRVAVRQGMESDRDVVSDSKLKKISELSKRAASASNTKGDDSGGMGAFKTGDVARFEKSHSDELIGKWAALGKMVQPRTALECVEVGLQLQIVKRLTPEGGLWDRVNALGFNKADASKFMACARRFDSVRDAALLTAAGSAYKLVELLSLSNEEIAAMGTGAEVRGMTLDTMPTKTAQQLRKALGNAARREGVMLTADEERMLRNFRKCLPHARAHVAQAAELLAALP